MDESRKQFLEFAKKQNLSLAYGDCGYVYSSTEMAWRAWQASRSAVELDIDWPEANDDTWMEGEDGAYARGHEDGKDKVVIAVREAIRAAGIKVKE